uniref:SIN3-HDAC complex associated factor n=1 Tax=Nomascus leucogenys TaxID=61853 RepID=A0A2I3GM86_NOMLE
MLLHVEQLLLEDYCPEEKIFDFCKPKMYQSIEGCCICRDKSSSSRSTDSKCYEKDFQSRFGLHETCSGDLCNACVLLVKRRKKVTSTLKRKKVKILSGNRIKSIQISKLQKEFERHNSDAHNTTSNAPPAQSPCNSNQLDDSSDTEMVFELTYWKRQKRHCGVIYKGCFGEVLIDTHLFKPCCRHKKAKPEEQGPEPLSIPTQEWRLRFSCKKGTKKTKF